LDSLASTSLLTLEIILLIASVGAGFIGALVGLGGGVLLVPLLTLAFGIDLRYAVGISLVCVIATSSGAAIAFLRDGYVNVRLGLLLEMATTVGALTGAFLASYVAKSAIGIIFGVMLLTSAYLSTRPKPSEHYEGQADQLASALSLQGTYPEAGDVRNYNITGVPLGFGLMYLAGILSALLGVGSGALKVLAMDNVMKVPFKVSTTTSNFMIGVTAATSAGVYLGRGYIDPTLATPVMLGILVGSMIGARMLHRIPVKTLRKVFAVIICIVGVQMIYKGITGDF
jgi:uncharacterized membrane protein YfcA